MTQPRLITREDGDRIAAEVDAEMEKEKHEATRAFDRLFADYLTARAAAMSWTASDKKSNVACDKLYEVIRTSRQRPHRSQGTLAISLKSCLLSLMMLNQKYKMRF